MIGKYESSNLDLSLEDAHVLVTLIMDCDKEINSIYGRLRDLKQARFKLTQALDHYFGTFRTERNMYDVYGEKADILIRELEKLLKDYYNDTSKKEKKK